MVSPEDLHLFRITDDVETAVREVVQFYRGYHSMRYVGDDLVLRLQRPLPARVLDRLNDEFRPIITEGRIEQVRILEDENGELPELPRLKLRFDRKSLGRLRQCIDAINAAAD